MSTKGKRKATKVAAPEVDEEDDVLEAEEAPKKKPTAKKARPTKITEPCTDALGWEIVPPSLIWRDFDTKPSEKIAAIDMDGTLVVTKSGSEFPVDADDWQLFNDNVPSVVQGYHEDGYKIAIFSNQGAIKSALDGKAATNQKNRFANVIKKLGVPVQAYMATMMNDPMRKPDKGMWDHMTTNCNGGKAVDLKNSFYIGDAAGRTQDHSAADKEFAANVGIAFKLPEDAFGPPSKTAAGGGGAVAVEANAPIVAMFKAIADYWQQNGTETNDKFKATANRKVATALAGFEQPISESNLKEVNKLAGVGKASIDKIKEYLKTGTCGAYEAIKKGPAGGEGSGAAAGQPSKDADMAANFM